MSDPADLTAEQARIIILDISRRHGWVPPRLRESQDEDVRELLISFRLLRESFGDAIETISQGIYSGSHRFILELLQNAEDCTFSPATYTPYISFEVTQNKIVVECNEKGFTETDIRQICHTGKSWKEERPGYIGEKGIGFKSVFKVASRVHIQSNAFAFSLEYDGGPMATSEAKPGMVTPIPEDDPIPQDQRPLTRKTLTLNSSTDFNYIVDQFRAVPESLLIFLSNLKEIKIRFNLPNEELSGATTFRKTIDEANGITTISKLSESAHHVDQWRYHVFKSMATELPNDPARRVRQDNEDYINESEIVLAFPVATDEEGLPRIATQHDVFAFLPVCTVGFNFLIQADFLLQASRENVIVDSLWKKAIIGHIIDAFCNAMVRFSRSNTLRFHWMRFLPISDRSFSSNSLWRDLSSGILQKLTGRTLLYSCFDREEPSVPEDLRTLPDNYLDRDGSPLFADRPGINGRYLSLSYEFQDIDILRRAFGIHDIEDTHIYRRIREDLGSPTSRMKGRDTSDDWHTRAAQLLMAILERSPSVGYRLRELDGLIPLNDGTWTRATGQPLYLPPETGPAIPQNLLTTIDAEAASNPSRKELFRRLGATECPPGEVITRLWMRYLRGDAASNLASSQLHLKYLYWHNTNDEDPSFSRLWIYDHRMLPVKPRFKVIYFGTDDEYGPRELLRSVPDPSSPQRIVPECSVPYANDVYMELYPSNVQRRGRSWLSWLQNVLGVRRIPRLKYPAGALSSEMRHIIQYRPEKIIGLLHQNWQVYRNEITDPIILEFKKSEVTCVDGGRVALCSTYFPSPDLIRKAEDLGVHEGFPFLMIPGPVQNRSWDDWAFLARLGVTSEENFDHIFFYLDILQHHRRPTDQTWNTDIRNGIIRTYELIADHYRHIDRAMLV